MPRSNTLIAPNVPNTPSTIVPFPRKCVFEHSFLVFKLSWNQTASARPIVLDLHNCGEAHYDVTRSWFNTTHMDCTVPLRRGTWCHQVMIQHNTHGLHGIRPASYDSQVSSQGVSCVIVNRFQLSAQQEAWRINRLFVRHENQKSIEMQWLMTNSDGGHSSVGRRAGATSMNMYTEH